MTEKSTNDMRSGLLLFEYLKDSAVIFLAVVFVVLYAAAYAGKLDPLSDSSILLRLEPVIFILIGYSFARIASRKAEQTLVAEVSRQAQRAEAAQFAKESAIQDREALEERMKNLKIVLGSESPAIDQRAIERMLDS